MPYVKTWLQKFPVKMRDDTKTYITGLFSTYVDPGFKFIKKNCAQGIDQVMYRGPLTLRTTRVGWEKHMYVHVYTYGNHRSVPYNIYTSTNILHYFIHTYTLYIQ